MTQQYSDASQTKRTRFGRSLRDLCAAVTAELEYKLGILIDKDFPDYASYLEAVSRLTTFHIDFILKKKYSKVKTYYIRIAKSAFFKFLRSLSPDCPAPSCPYFRIIWDDEAEKIAAHIYDAWGYDTSYWYPLAGKYCEDKLFIAPKWVKPYMEDIHRLLGLPQNHIYNYGDEWYDRPHCAEVDVLEDYEPRETAYIAKDYSWIIYYSHENTITFAGIIVPRIKDILHAEKEHWNRFG